MWVCGALGIDRRETGIIEEMQLENRRRNPLANFSVWDSVLYEAVRFEPNIDLILNCSVCDIEMEGSRRIRAVKGWQMTTQTWHRVEAPLFADCSGDSILAPLSGAEFRVGREGQDEYGESIAPGTADRKTMGMSLEINVRELDRPVPFTPPPWAYVYPTNDDLPNREHDIRANHFWWIELGGEDDSIRDTERLRDELLKIVFGVWDHVKNRGDHGADNLALEWVGFLPGKRESRRYIGDHVLTQNDVRDEGRFDDIVAYGGWPMDDHHPAGFRHPGDPTVFHAAPSPFGIPYRSLYSRNIDNLLFAGRNISVSHAAMSSTRVMATCAVIGQAAGTAAAIAARDSLSPRGVYERSIGELQQALMDDDCWLPWKTREIPSLTRTARLTASEGDPGPLVNGVDRPFGGPDNGWTAEPGGWVELSFDRTERVKTLRAVFDSDLNRCIRSARNTLVLKDEDPAGSFRPEMRCYFPRDMEPLDVPDTLVRSFRIEVPDGDGGWKTVRRIGDNCRRLVRVALGVDTAAVRLVPESTWGAPSARMFACDVR
jgi:hypothetical protein